MAAIPTSVMNTEVNESPASVACVHPPERKKKLALLVNIIAPTRVPLFSILADHFDLLLLHGGQEANRVTWRDYAQALPNARVVRAWGWQFHFAKKLGREVFDEKFLHITPGMFWHLLRFQPDVVVSNEMGFRSLLALVYGTVFRKPVWVWWGGTLHSERNVGALRKIIRKIISVWADRWISYGHTSTEYLLSLGVKRERILQSQNAVDDQRFQVAVEPAWEIWPKPVVLYTGQFIERKGVASLLETAATVQRSGYDFSLLLVGNGRDQEALENRAKALALKNVHFRPAQRPSKMPSVYRSADVLVFPTLEDVWGLVVNEALLSGLPVLCSRYAGCAQEFFSEQNIFSPEDSRDFARKLKQAVLGQLPKTSLSCVKTTEELGHELVQELNNFPARAQGSILSAPAKPASPDL
jgi:glycosyltransferase involved in cell wall biosynthesis